MNIIFIIEAASLPSEIFKKRFKKEKRSESSIWEVQLSLFSRYFQHLPSFHLHFTQISPHQPQFTLFSTLFRRHLIIRSLFLKMRQSNWVNRFQWRWENVILCRIWISAQPQTINQKWNHLKHSTQKRILDTVFFKTDESYQGKWVSVTNKRWPATLE